MVARLAFWVLYLWFGRGQLVGRYRCPSGRPVSVYAVRRWGWPLKGYGAITLGDRIIIHPRLALTNSILCHECKHADQWAAYGGLRFALAYLYGILIFGYRQNPFEVEARDAEGCGEVRRIDRG